MGMGSPGRPWELSSSSLLLAVVVVVVGRFEGILAQSPVISSCPVGGKLSPGTDVGVDYATNGGSGGLVIPQCPDDPAASCSHATDAESPDGVTLNAVIQKDGVWVPVDRAHRECTPTSATASDLTVAACANADIGHDVDESTAEQNCITGDFNFCTFTVSTQRFRANSAAPVETVKLVAED
eukprot:COSAG02_NODE_28500_length_588_cov_1.000000_1_plen_181_part_10